MNEDVLSAQVLFSPCSSKCAGMKCVISAVEEDTQQSFNMGKTDCLDATFPVCLDATFKRKRKKAVD